MSAIDNKRYYWLKLDKDFFKRHDIRIVESMQNGKDYILFYLKLLCESTSHEGYLRFSPTIPYSEDMLATITNTNIDVVRSAIKIFSGLGMMSFLDDGTLYLEQVERMIGSESGAAIRMRNSRELAKTLENKSEQSGNKQEHCSQEIDIELEKDKELEIEKDLEKEKNGYNQIEPDRSNDGALPKDTTAMAIAKTLSRNGYVSEEDITLNGYDDLIGYWMGGWGFSPVDLKVRIRYFLNVWRRNQPEIKNRFLYFKASIEESFGKSMEPPTMEGIAEAMEEASKEWGDDDA